MLVSGTGRAATRGGGPVIELDCGITVYPAREEQGRWRAVWHENGARQQCEAASEAKLAAKLAKVIERLEADAPNMTLRGADLIAFYLSPDRLPAQRQWSRKHAHTQRRLCERFAAPVIGAIGCQEITTGHMQKIVNAAPTPGEGGRVRGMDSALVTAGLEGGYLASPRLAKVHWQAGDRPMPPPRATVAGESALWIDPAEVPAEADVAGLGRALATGRHGDRDELMAVTAAYSGLRWVDLAALTIAQVDPAARVISVDRKVVEVAGHLYVEAPKNHKYRRTIYPRRTPAGHPLAEALAVVRLQPQRPQARLPRRRLARSRRQRKVDPAQPAARLLHNRLVHPETRRHGRVPHGRPAPPRTAVICAPLRHSATADRARLIVIAVESGLDRDMLAAASRARRCVVGSPPRYCAVVRFSKSPVWYASTTAWTRSRRPSLARMCVTCVLTVVSLM